MLCSSGRLGVCDLRYVYVWLIVFCFMRSTVCLRLSFSPHLPWIVIQSAMRKQLKSDEFHTSAPSPSRGELEKQHDGAIVRR